MSAPAQAPGFRDYGEGACATVHELYRLNHRHQTLDFVVKGCLPPEALYMIRYHSFYAAHRENGYGFLMDERDYEMFRWVRAFNPYDLYSKNPVRADRRALERYYRELVSEFLPEPLRF